MSGAPPWLHELLAREALPPEFAEEVYRVHRPLAGRIEAWARARPGLVVGICGPQGTGKSTLAAVLERMLAEAGLRAATLSLDDLYLTRAEREVLARSVHPLFRTRGPPGTHDAPLGCATLDALRRPAEVRLPRFDKATDDRLPLEEWTAVEGPVDAVLFEGWCVGARPQPHTDLHAPVNRLEADEDRDGRWRRHVNAALAGAYQDLFARIDRLILLQPPSFEAVLGWRTEQERKLRDRLGREDRPGRAMSDGAVARFVRHYERLTRWITVEAPARADIVLLLDERRRVRLR